MNVNRRIFLKQGAFAFVCSGLGPLLGPGFLRQAAMATELGSTTSSRNKILLCIFQRGAVDGLSMVVPYGDPDYAKVRPDISLGAPSVTAGANATIDLDGYFGLHPALDSLAPLFRSGSLAAIQACGSPNATRSHFTSQDLMESGIDHPGPVQDGWLNRLMACCPEDAAKRSAFRSVAMTSVTPRSLQGAEESIAMQDLNSFGLIADNFSALPTTSASTTGAFESMYGSAVDTVLHGTAQESFDAMSLLKDTRSRPYVPANGATYPKGNFARNLQQIAQLIKANVGVQIAFAEVDGWDTHAVQGNASGTLARQLKPFGDSLAAFHRDMGDKMADVTVVTMSEFGRTVKQNGNRGTDHGHGTCFFTMGGSVKGGKVYGEWPTLAPDKLFQDRDLAVTTDFRDVFGEICARHFNVPLSDMGKLFPDYALDAKNFRNFCTG